MLGSKLAGLTGMQPGERRRKWGECPRAHVHPQWVAVGTRDWFCVGAGQSWVLWDHGSDCTQIPVVTEEGKGVTEIRSPCECEALVQFQTNTVAILQSLTEKNILWGDVWACGAQGSLGTDCM